MATTVYDEGTLLVDAAAPTPADVETAKATLAVLEGISASGRPFGEGELRRVFETGIPDPIRRLFLVLLEEFSKGHAVAVTSSEKELTTREAAEYLGVSRPHVVKLVDAGLISSRKVGAHRRIMLEDVAAYSRRTRERHHILDELASEAQEMGLYDQNE